MNKFDGLPPIVAQMLEAVMDKKTPEHIKFNYFQSLEKIRDCCDMVIKKYKKN